jgi:asparagine synthase (glutamine-hydrolysing)
MCGILYAKEVKSLDQFSFDKALTSILFRGPDNKSIVKLNNNEFLGHNRLELIGGHFAKQPIVSPCTRYIMAYNGELYNIQELSEKYNTPLKNNSDTALIIELFSKYGIKIFEELVGMFAILIVDKISGDLICVRDRIGIKPLYYFERGIEKIVCSMTVGIRSLVNSEICHNSLEEWQDLRRQIPGKTFFSNISEYLPGKIYINNKIVSSFDSITPDPSKTFSILPLINIIKSHEIRDKKYDYASFLSSGIDSSIITKITKPSVAYTAGSNMVNEYKLVEQYAEFEKQKVKYINLEKDKFNERLEELLKLTKEPSTLPNEVLIYDMCKKMPKNQKIIFSGEGADEFFFGYDQLVRFSIRYGGKQFLNKFIDRYRYRKTSRLERFNDYINDIARNIDSVSFIEDFLIKFHLPGLLKRADHSTMAASKECRVPFSDFRFLSYTYRKDITTKLNDQAGKLQLRKVLKELGLGYLENRPKKPFSYKSSTESYAEHYLDFQNTQMEILQWK